MSAHYSTSIWIRLTCNRLVSIRREKRPNDLRLQGDYLVIADKVFRLVCWLFAVINDGLENWLSSGECVSLENVVDENFLISNIKRRQLSKYFIRIVDLYLNRAACLKLTGCAGSPRPEPNSTRNIDRRSINRHCVLLVRHLVVG